MGRWRRRPKHTLDGLRLTPGYWKLKEEALDRSQWKTRYGRRYVSVVRQTTEWKNESTNEWINEWTTHFGTLKLTSILFVSFRCYKINFNNICHN